MILPCLLLGAAEAAAVYLGAYAAASGDAWGVVLILCVPAAAYLADDVFVSTTY